MDRARGIAAEEADHVAQILRADPQRGIGVGHVGAVARRVDHARQHRVHVDAVMLELGREALGQAHHHALGGTVGAHVTLALQRAERPHVHDRPASAGDHAGHRCAHGVLHRGHVDLVHLRPLAVGDFPGARPHRETAGEVEQPVHRTDLSEARGSRAGIAEIDAQAQRAVGRRVGGKCEVQQHRVGAERAGAFADSAPQRAGGAGDHDAFALQSHEILSGGTEKRVCSARIASTRIVTPSARRPPSTSCAAPSCRACRWA